jgi:hypothetical protein
VRLVIVAAETPLSLIGPCGRLMWTTATSGYDAAPALVGAKLNRAGDDADDEGGRAMDRFGYLPMMSSRFTVTQTFRSWVLTTAGSPQTAWRDGHRG